MMRGTCGGYNSTSSAQPVSPEPNSHAAAGILRRIPFVSLIVSIFQVRLSIKRFRIYYN
jgi:hypothetical protein